jgi:uncharacterized damage-inducible protein DinB
MRDKIYLRALIDYNAWANAETYRLVAEMPPEEVTKKRQTPLQSIFVSLNHLLNVDRIWLAHMQGEEHGIAGLREVQYESLDDLWQARQEMDRSLQDYVDSLSEDALEEIVDYELIGGNKGSLSRAMCLTHLATHGSYHRGWISDMFGQADCQQPSTDIPVYERALREQGGKPLP